MTKKAIATSAAVPMLLSDHDIDAVRGGIRVGDFFTGSGSFLDDRSKDAAERRLLIDDMGK